MTVLDERQLIDRYAVPSRSVPVWAPVPVPVRRGAAVRASRRAPVRPDIAPMRYRGSGVAVSRTPHTRRPVSTAVTVALAGLAALITLWLGFLGHFRGDRAAAPAVSPDRLAVVQVQAGETLQHLAVRVAPDAPVQQVVDRIRELNDMDTAAVDAGQTLIAPIG